MARSGNLHIKFSLNHIPSKDGARLEAFSAAFVRQRENNKALKSSSFTSSSYGSSLLLSAAFRHSYAKRSFSIESCSFVRSQADLRRPLLRLAGLESLWAILFHRNDEAKNKNEKLYKFLRCYK